MPILTTAWNDLVKNATVLWREGYDSVPLAARTLYDVRSTSVMTSEHSQIDGPGFAKRKNEGSAYTIGSPKQGYSLTLSQVRIGLMESVTWEMRKFDKYREIEKKMRGLGESTAQRLELDLTHQFTFGFDGTTYTNMDGESIGCATGDSVALFSNSHTTKTGATNIDNLITNTFSRTGLEAAEKQFVTSMIDQNERKVIVRPDTIITSDDPATVNAVKEFLTSQGAPDTAERADNVYKGKYKHLILPYLATSNVGAYNSAKAAYWMLADVAHTDAVCEISEEPNFSAASPNQNSDDFKTDDWYFKSSACYDMGILDPKWIVGSNAST